MEAWPRSLVSEERLRSLLLVEIRAQSPLLCTLNQIQIHHRQPQGRLINRQSPEYRLHRIHTKEAGFAQISFYWPTKSSNVENCTHAAKTEMQARAPKNMITQYP
ncbi:hypothetical protein Vi05172_g13448 [Venturia inaequalis]|nr:hypothetical protein Vi05172_g13448 [Venturia inaequalis]